ncbi:disulfide oxidoreductase [Salinibacillus xinjiangensis]|uniref:Probable disulfide formation protein n=1 Tax=Salinibacillus xinjiangensis TaxID=1229268 RepID=A0A6G1X7M6_9BACI|nr:disulfide oxidoreductase [Salinibacillus xinjiangensis]MRG86947.1 disulfide bond formation protein B [Salinibacillus xinjiangensis]
MTVNKTIENLLLIMWGVAFIATCGSLFYSEIMHYEPCKLCWFQRILMYPLVIILGTAIAKKNLHMAWPGFILSLIGAPLALYHYIVQKVESASTGDFCGQVSCTAEYVNYFGFVTIPFMSFVAFTAILIMYMVILVKGKER